MQERSVLLVRHGQASFGKSDYDNLSELGHRQARLLGEDLARRGWTPDRIVCGSMKRHRQTLAEIAVGAGWDHDLEVDGDWNELDHEAVIRVYKPAYKNMLVLKADMVRTLRPREAFEAMFVAAMERWAGGEHDADYPEPYPVFRDRVDTALARVLEAPEAKQLVVSSVGAISHVAASLLAEGSPEAWRGFSLSGVNTGVTRLAIDKRGPKVLSFNEIGHLDADPVHLVTQR